MFISDRPVSHNRHTERSCGEGVRRRPTDARGELPTNRRPPGASGPRCTCKPRSGRHRPRLGRRNRGSNQRQIRIESGRRLRRAPPRPDRVRGDPTARTASDSRPPMHPHRPRLRTRSGAAIRRQAAPVADCEILSDRNEPRSPAAYLSGNPAENPAAMRAAAMTDSTAMLHMANLFDCGPSGFTVA